MLVAFLNDTRKEIITSSSGRDIEADHLEVRDGISAYDLLGSC